MRYNSHTIKFAPLFKRTALWFSWSRRIVQPSLLIPEHFHDSKEKSGSISSAFPLSHPSTPWEPQIYFVSAELPILGIFENWNDAEVFGEWFRSLSSGWPGLFPCSVIRTHVFITAFYHLHIPYSGHSPMDWGNCLYFDYYE